MKRQITLSVMAIALALSVNLTSCTNDDNFAEETTIDQPTAISSIDINVEAGFDEALTRADVGTNHDLKFTSGDKLFVRKTLEYDESSGDTKILVGELTVKSLTNSDKTATFQGTLNVKEIDGTSEGVPIWKDGTYSLNPSDDILNSASATLFQAGSTYEIDGWYNVNRTNFKRFALTADELIKTEVDVQGQYDSDAKSFKLNYSNDCIFDFTITGLADVDYKVELVYTEGNVSSLDGLTSQEDYTGDYTDNPKFLWSAREYEGEVTASGEQATFAMSWDAMMTYDRTVGLRLTKKNDSTPSKIIRLGYTIKDGGSAFTSKTIYKIKKAYTDPS